MENKILVIGACNIDIQGVSSSIFIPNDSNIGDINVGFGGVGRNIADNLNKLIPNVKMITVLGNDEYSKSIKTDLENKGIDISDSLICDYPISTYLSILNEKREMIAAIADMKILKFLSLDFLKTKIDVINNSEIIVIDTNLDTTTLQFLASIKKENQIFVSDTVSVKKAKNLNCILESIDILKTNKLEIKSLTGIDDIDLACKFLIDNGVKMLFLTLGKDGVKYYSKTKCGYIPNPPVDVVDVTGAGDIFTSTLVYAYSLGFNICEMAKIAQCASIIKIQEKGTVPKSFTKEKLINEYMKLKEKK
ncbi:carbohydrate kinase family protein [Caviibacter abscessus]|uniref:carbohydrate kinase family protein n=1 Tax=Caviibacter abscessus TaxID=1766719 RepID=UPI00082AC1D3|nr:carbohydrate kinase family protein [Caviibacter abscessus]